jgi:DNA polymerase-3 subunit delta'
MFDSLLVHPQTKSTLTALSVSLPHALLLTGPNGIGKSTLAVAWATAVTEGKVGNSTEIGPDDKGTIGIASIRDLYKTTRNKQAGQQVVYIDHAELMGSEAQNAFLKLLEEPREGLTFVLSAPRLELLLPTILSRVQHVAIQPMPDAALSKFVLGQNSDIPAGDLAQLLFIAHGRPGALQNMLASPERLDIERQRMIQAKTLLTNSLYDRYLTINKLASDRTQCLATLEAMLHITSSQLLKAGQAQQGRWISIADNLQTTLQRITQNGNIRAQLLYLFSSYK